MKYLTALFVLFATSVIYANTTVVYPLTVLPKRVVSFANEPHSSVYAEKKLIELFLTEGKSTPKLSKDETAIDETTNIEQQTTISPDGSVTTEFVLGGCSGVFTDESGVVYFWRLSCPRILGILSQDRKTTYIVLKDEHLDLIHGYKRANQALVPTPMSVTPAADAPVAPATGAAHL